ncbi:MAG TPA: hypothetical protein VN723_10120 [Rhizomicrobium sp.]|nr:hypothetical protein [Rhizomicrobium sp.]
MRPADALVTGFVKSPLVLEQSLAPLRKLRFDGVIRHIHYVTWDSAELDAWLAPLALMGDIKLTRVPQPDVTGNGNQRGVVYQVKNLEAGLSLLQDEDALVLKYRPDFIASTRLLRDKITNFDRLCAPVSITAPNGIEMPAPVLAHKIWIPWADSNQPFFYEDAAFMGTLRDIKKLVTPLDGADHAMLGTNNCGSYAHVVRFAKIFRERWPLFDGYLRHYDFFVNDLWYRMKLVAEMLDDGFFWHVLIAHAWILYSQFHVDSGAPHDLRFYANNVNQDADWSRPETLKLANPYDDLAGWRADTRPGEATHSVRRAYGRLVDDAWQTALFTQALSDFPAETLAGLMTNAAASRDGRLAEIETDFYARLDRFYRGYWGKARRAA